MKRRWIALAPLVSLAPVAAPAQDGACSWQGDELVCELTGDASDPRSDPYEAAADIANLVYDRQQRLALNSVIALAVFQNYIEFESDKAVKARYLDAVAKKMVGKYRDDVLSTVADVVVPGSSKALAPLLLVVDAVIAEKARASAAATSNRTRDFLNERWFELDQSKLVDRTALRDAIADHYKASGDQASLTGALFSVRMELAELTTPPVRLLLRQLAEGWVNSAYQLSHGTQGYIEVEHRMFDDGEPGIYESHVKLALPAYADKLTDLLNDALASADDPVSDIWDLYVIKKACFWVPAIAKGVHVMGAWDDDCVYLSPAGEPLQGSQLAWDWSRYWFADGGWREDLTVLWE